MCIMTCHCNEKSNNLIIIYSQCVRRCLLEDIMRFYLDYTVCATPYLAHDTYLHGPGISVPSRRVKTSLS